MSDPVKVGVVGVGTLGSIHAQKYAGLEQADLVGVYDADPARAEEVAGNMGVRSFESLEALADKVQAVSVVVPTVGHSEVASALMRKGIHLLVEKPIAGSTEEAEAMVAAAREKGVLLQVGHVERFNPVFAYLEQVAGNPRFIESHRLAPYPPPREGSYPRGTEVSVVLDLMIHDLEVILHLVGEDVVDIHAVGVSVLSPSEDIANARLSFTNGCVANVTASRISPEPMRKIRVFQEDTYLSLDYQQQAGEIYKKNATGISREKVPIEKEEPLVLELRSFLDCVAHHHQPVVTGEHAAKALTLAVDITHRIRGASS